MQHKILCGSLLLLNLFGTEILAHNVKTNVDVGVTFHIEPDHSPSVGEESQAWFALTRKGGELIPLTECDCDLKVYLESNNQSATNPILNPPLIAISPEQYQNIPGANLIFPQPGIYQLELTGKPTQEGNFTPFQVSYPVTVKPGLTTSQKTEKKVSEAPQAEENKPFTSDEKQTDTNPETTTNNTKIYTWLIGLLIGGLAVFGINKVLSGSKQTK